MELPFYNNPETGASEFHVTNPNAAKGGDITEFPQLNSAVLGGQPSAEQSVSILSTPLSVPQSTIGGDQPYFGPHYGGQMVGAPGSAYHPITESFYKGYQQIPDSVPSYQKSSSHFLAKALIAATLVGGYVYSNSIGRFIGGLNRISIGNTISEAAHATGPSAAVRHNLAIDDAITRDVTRIANDASPEIAAHNIANNLREHQAALNNKPAGQRLLKTLDGMDEKYTLYLSQHAPDMVSGRQDTPEWATAHADRAAIQQEERKLATLASPKPTKANTP